MNGEAKQVLVLGGGFGGVYTARHLERQFPPGSGVEITLVNQDNFFLMTPFLFEAFSGMLELRHCAVPIRDFLRHTRFLEANVDRIDLDGRTVHASAAEGDSYRLTYDQLVLAMGAVTNTRLIPGSEHAFTFKTVADALEMRNHVIERFERADVETDPARRRRLLTFAVIGGGLVGVEVFGELTAFAEDIRRYYPQLRADDLRFYLLQNVGRILPEVDARLAAYAQKVLSARPGVQIITGRPVERIEPDRLIVGGETIEADTIVLSAGVVPSPGVAKLPLLQGKRGHVIVDPTMRSPERPEVWALGDSAIVRDPAGKPYPNLAQISMRQGKQLARNIGAVLAGRAPRPFVYDLLGLMGALGRYEGFGKVLGVRLRGFVAWWVRRTYYLMVMPRWSRRLRIIADWTISFLFRPDIVKVDLDCEPMMVLRGSAAGTLRDMQHPPNVSTAFPR